MVPPRKQVKDLANEWGKKGWGSSYVLHTAFNKLLKPGWGVGWVQKLGSGSLRVQMEHPPVLSCAWIDEG